MLTESGAQSIGAPNSAARFNEEARHAASADTQYQVLLLTEEGRALLTSFAASVGCDFQLMDNKAASNWIDSEAKTLFSFLRGVNLLYSKL